MKDADWSATPPLRLGPLFPHMPCPYGCDLEHYGSHAEDCPLSIPPKEEP